MLVNSTLQTDTSIHSYNINTMALWPRQWILIWNILIKADESNDTKLYKGYIAELVRSLWIQIGFLEDSTKTLKVTCLWTQSDIKPIRVYVHKAHPNLDNQQIGMLGFLVKENGCERRTFQSGLGLGGPIINRNNTPRKNEVNFSSSWDKLISAAYSLHLNLLTL